MRALVTGAAGFLGRYVVRALRDDGYEVTAFDLLEMTEPGTRAVVGDLMEQDQLDEAIRGHDVVCHVGAIGDVYLAAERPELAAAVNVVGSTNVAAAAARAGARVVYASTWEVYGTPRYEPVDEDHPCDPDHPYNITKLGGERMLLAADHLHGVPVVALRLGTAYGLGMRPNSVFELFMERARNQQPIVIQGDGSQSRQFTHASDIARAFLLASRSDVHGSPLNVVSPETVSIKQLAETVVARFPTDVVYGEPRPGDVPPSYVSAKRIEEVLGWSPRVGFEQGMSELLDAAAARS